VSVSLSVLQDVKVQNQTAQSKYNSPWHMHECKNKSQIWSYYTNVRWCRLAYHSCISITF